MPHAKLIDASTAEYHADPCEVPSLNYSTAKAIILESPQVAAYYHPRLGGHSRKPTESKGNGQAIHQLLLGGPSDIVVIRADNFRTKAAQEMRDAAIAAGKTPIIAHEWDDLVSTAETLHGIWRDQYGIDLRNPVALREQAVEWDEMTDAGPVRCRGRFDYLDLAIGQALDPKSTACAHPLKVQRQIMTLGYAIQEAAYSSAMVALEPSLQGRVDFRFLFMELDAPHGTLGVCSTEAMKEYGRMQWNRAVRIWQKCLVSGKWPGYADGWYPMAPSNWAMEQELGEQE